MPLLRKPSDTGRLSERHRKALHRCRLLLLKEADVNELLDALAADEGFRPDVSVYHPQAWRVSVGNTAARASVPFFEDWIIKHEQILCQNAQGQETCQYRLTGMFQKPLKNFFGYLI